MITDYYYLPEAQQKAVVREPLWWKLKVLLLWVFIVAVVTVIIIVLVTAHFYAQAKKRKTITRAILKISNNPHSETKQRNHLQKQG